MAADPSSPQTPHPQRLVPPAPGERAPRVPPPVMEPPEKQQGLFVNEVFTSIQGEGNLMGLPTVFLRTTGCHLRCSWCDTPYSFHEGEWRSKDQILEQLKATGLKRLCLTGGEPLLQRDAWPLVEQLLQDDWQVTLETSGSLSLENATRIRDRLGEQARSRLLLSIDMKCPGSGEERSWRPDNLQHLLAHDQLKFIIQDERDYQWARDRVRALAPLPCPAWFHPEGGRSGKVLTMIADRLAEDRLDARLGIQLHKLAWGEKRGT